MNFVKILSILLFFIPTHALSQNLLQDVTGDEVVRILAYGDSLTFGVGDGVAPNTFVEEAPRTDGSMGYPARVRTIAGVEVINAGEPGELLTDGSDARFARALQNSGADLVVIMEGSNDSVFQISGEQYGRALQKIINIARALGRNILVGSLPPTCCDRGAQNLFITLYNTEILNAVSINQLSFFDSERAYEFTCPDLEECSYLNRPEGIHPNTLGYDLLSELVLASLFGVDLFEPGGSVNLESALGLEEGSVTVLAPIVEEEE